MEKQACENLLQSTSKPTFLEQRQDCQQQSHGNECEDEVVQGDLLSLCWTIVEAPRRCRQEYVFTFWVCPIDSLAAREVRPFPSPDVRPDELPRPWPATALALVTDPHRGVRSSGPDRGVMVFRVP